MQSRLARLAALGALGRVVPHFATSTRVAHTIDRSWDASEAFVRSQLCGAACSSAFLPGQWRMQDGVDGQPDGDLLWRGWANDASAAVIP